MKNNLLTEINRFKTLSNIDGQQDINEQELLNNIKNLISIASDDVKDNETYKDLMSFFNSLTSDETSDDEVISGSYSAEGQKNAYDALHSFQSRVSDKFGGKINTKVKEGIERYKDLNDVDSVDIKSVKIDIDPNTLTVDWEVTIGPSDDGYTYEEFDSRGSAGGGESAVDDQLNRMHSLHSGTPKLVHHYNETIPVCFNSDGTKKTNGCSGKINIQQKFFKYGKKI